MWEGFGVMLGVNLLGLLVIILRRDLVWCIGAVWVCVSVWSSRPKAAPVVVSLSSNPINSTLELSLTLTSWWNR